MTKTSRAYHVTKTSRASHDTGDTDNNNDDRTLQFFILFLMLRTAFHSVATTSFKQKPPGTSNKLKPCCNPHDNIYINQNHTGIIKTYPPNEMISQNHDVTQVQLTWGQPLPPPPPPPLGTDPDSLPLHEPLVLYGGTPPTIICPRMLSAG